VTNFFNNSDFYNMARLCQLPSGKMISAEMTPKDKMRKALEFLRENPDEKPVVAARIYKIKNEISVRQAWYRERKKLQREQPIKWGGQNISLRPEQR